MDISELLNGLNEQQRQAVTAPDGQVLVLAGPGSGKTRVLTYRAAYLVLGQGVRPYHVLAVTFTNKAAREMQARLEKLLGDEEAHSLWLGTFHSVCARILRREVEYLPVKSNFVIMDADDQETIVKRAIRELKLDEKLYRPASIHAAISTAKNNLIIPKDYPSRTYRDEVVARVYTRYQDLLVENNSVDFDDLLLYSVRLLEENPRIQERYSLRFEHVLVDEFQDTNIAQYRLLQLMTTIHHSLFVVGDEDQSIYRWRGADYRNVLRFEEDYPRCQKILLEQNYRSTQTVLDAARAVIDRNPYRTPKHLFSDRGHGERIVLHEAVNDHAEAAFVVDTIQQNLASGRVKASEFAVMYRTNAQSRLLEEAFLRSGVPYRLVGAQRFYGRREVKDLIAYLRLVQNPSDEISLGRVINVPPRGIGDKTLVNLQLIAQQTGLSAGDLLLDLGRKGMDSNFWKEFSGRGAGVLADFGGMLVSWRDQLDRISLPALFDKIVSDIVFQPYIDDGTEEGSDRWENVQELRRLAFEYEERGLPIFLETLALVSDQDTLPEQANAPTLLTLHAAKGLEFGQVFIIGMDDGLLPHSRSLDEPEEMAEERRLFYVGLTRAKNRLYLVRADQRTTYGGFESSIPSRFLRDIPDGLLQRSSARRSGRESSYSSYREDRKERDSRWHEDTRWNGGTTLAPRSATPPPAQPAPVVQQQYKASMRVRHPVWGEGMVIESRLLDGEETLDVVFESVGFKRLLASLAKLEIIQT
jgi:DNA helicase-2/ATP-dependent DNA helicase PcrA